MPTSTFDTNRIDKGPSITKGALQRRRFFSGLVLGILGFIGAPIWAFYKGFTITYNHFADNDKNTASDSNNQKINWFAFAAAIPAGLFSLVVNTPTGLVLAPFEASKLGVQKGFKNGLKIIFEPVSYINTFIFKQEVHNPLPKFFKIYKSWANEINDLSFQIENNDQLPELLKAINKVPKLISTYKQIQKMYDGIVDSGWFKKVEMPEDEIIVALSLQYNEPKLEILNNILKLSDMVTLVEKKVSTYLSKKTNFGLVILDMEPLKKDIQEVLKLAYQSKKILIKNNGPKNILGLLSSKIDALKLLVYKLYEAYDGIDSNVLSRELAFLEESNQQNISPQEAKQNVNNTSQPLSMHQAIINQLNTKQFKEYKIVITSKPVANINAKTKTSMKMEETDDESEIGSYLVLPEPSSTSSKEEVDKKNLSQPTKATTAQQSAKPTTQPTPPKQPKGIFQAFVDSVHNFFSRGKKTTGPAENLSKGSAALPQQESHPTLI